ncbi:MAG: hypothetical protein HZB63_10195 [Deltaproteobacteria bacterium]|nr:hypothetical protein [Deltaproteobacteria bacterium]
MDRNRAGIVLIAIGSCLLAVSLLGRWTSLGKYPGFPPRPWERFDPVLSETTPDLASLYRAAQARVPQPLRETAPADAMQVLYETVADRFTHGDRATYSPFGNWLLWALGGSNRSFRDIQDPDVLLRGGHSALCGDVSFILMRLAGMAGIPARHVLLDGHIVMEARHDGSWHAFDPDLEVVVRDEAGVVLSAEALARRPDLVRRSYSGRGDPANIESIVAIYASTANTEYMTYPAQSIFGPQGQRPGRVEKAAHFAVFIIPGSMIAAGAALSAAAHRKTAAI